MKKIKIIIFIIITTLILTPITTTATPGKLKKATIVYCNNTKYGQHGKHNHWHKATNKNYATGPVLRVPCGLDNIKITRTTQTKKTIKITYNKINKVTGYIIYKKTGKTYKKIKTTTKTSYIDTKVKKGKKYSYKVKAYKKIGNKTYYGKSSKSIIIKKS